MVSEFLLATNINIPIQSPSNIQSAALNRSCPQCTVLQSTVSQFLTPTNIALPIQYHSNIQSAPLNMNFPTMNSPAINCYPILLTHQYLPSHSIPKYHPISSTHHAAPHYELSCNQLLPNSSHTPITPFPFNPQVPSNQQH